MKEINILQKIEQGLNPNWDLYTASRYLYLKSCEYFTYDYRYCCADRDFMCQIRQTKIDLQHVTDCRVVCKSWSSQVYIPLLKTIGIDGQLVGENRGHQYVRFPIGEEIIVADACMNSDLSRVKMNYHTLDFFIDNQNGDFSKNQRVDQQIGYIQDQYATSSLLKPNQLETMFQSEVDMSLLHNADELLIYKMYHIKELLESYTKVKEFYDCQFCLAYLINKLLNRSELEKIFVTDWYNSYFDDWNFMRLYEVRLTDQIIYFTLSNTDLGYLFYEITEQEMKNRQKLYQKRSFSKL